MKKIVAKWCDYSSDNELSICIDGKACGSGNKKELLARILNRVKEIKSGYDPATIDPFSTDVLSEIDRFVSQKRLLGLVGNLSFVLTTKQPDDSALGLKDDKYEVELKLSSRLDGSDGKPFSLIYMLEKLYPDEYFIPNTFSGSRSVTLDNIWEYLVVFQFGNLLQELKRYGFFSTYITCLSNDSKVRGSVDLPRHIKENLGIQNGRFACRFRRRTADNPMNCLIVRTYDHLRRKYPKQSSVIESSNEIRRTIDELRWCAPGYQHYSVKELININEKHISHPYFFRYELMRKLCVHILKNGGAALGDRMGDYKVRGYLINMSGLFEDYVKNNILERLFKGNGYSVYDQFRISHRGRSFFYEAKDKGDYYGRIIPDYVIKKGDNVHYVMDAKFKPSYFENYGIRFGHEDDVFKLVSDTVIVNSFEQSVGTNKKMLCFAFSKDIYNLIGAAVDAISRVYSTDTNVQMFDDNESVSAKQIRDALRCAEVLRFAVLKKKVYKMRSAIIAPCPVDAKKKYDPYQQIYRTTYGDGREEAEISVDLIPAPFIRNDDYNDYIEWRSDMEVINEEYRSMLKKHYV